LEDEYYETIKICCSIAEQQSLEEVPAKEEHQQCGYDYDPYQEIASFLVHEVNE
jgi:hypothetical protein